MLAVGGADLHSLDLLRNTTPNTLVFPLESTMRPLVHDGVADLEYQEYTGILKGATHNAKRKASSLWIKKTLYALI